MKAGSGRINEREDLSAFVTEASCGTIFFDYDGTLHDSMAIYGPAFRSAYAWLVESGYMPKQSFSDEWISHWLGYTTEAMWTTFAPDLPESVWRQAAAIVGKEMDARTLAGNARLFEGVPSMLTELKAHGFQIALLSNCRNTYCQVHRDIFHLDQWFDFYCAAEDYGEIPKNEMFVRAINPDLTHLSPEFVDHPLRIHASSQLPLYGPYLIVGDRFHDIEAAVSQGVPSIGCSYGFGEAHELDAATYRVNSPAEIVACITEAFAI